MDKKALIFQIQEWLKEWIIKNSDTKAPVDIYASYTSLGIYSMLLAKLFNDIEDHFKISVDIDSTYYYQNIDELSKAIADRILKKTHRE